MRQFIAISLLLLGILPQSAHSSPTPIEGDTSKTNCLEQASCLLDEAMDLMRKYYYRKDEVEWYAFSDKLKEKIEKCEHCEDIYTLINQCLREMGELHSFIMPPQNVAVYENQSGSSPVPLSQLLGEIKAGIISPGIAYLSVPWVRTTDEAICRMVADSLQHLIASLDKQAVSKWIIDLRGNTGGNCWPMLAGLGPLLGEGVCGYFVSHREKVAFSYADGAAMQGKHIRCQVNGLPYQTRSNHNQIAILTGPRTSSAGEIVAIAFRGKEGVSFFGESTAGFTTANGTYALSDKSMLVLSVCREADRTGYVYQGSINPDQLVNTPANPGSDMPVDAALMWLQAFEKN